MKFVKWLFGIKPPVFLQFIEEKLEPEDNPEFERTYRAQLTEEVSADVSFETSSYSGERRTGLGHLYQKNGNSVYYSVDRVAKEILDKTLVPKVLAFIESARALDEAWIKSKPNYFLDKKGRRWLLDS